MDYTHDKHVRSRIYLTLKIQHRENLSHVSFLGWKFLNQSEEGFRNLLARHTVQHIRFKLSLDEQCFEEV